MSKLFEEMAQGTTEIRSYIMTKKTNRVLEAILEMADDQLRSGLIDKVEHEKVTIRHIGSRGRYAH
jgi:hypothetical protein